MNDLALADLQRAIIQVLIESGSADEAVARLAAEDLSEEARAWIASFDPRAIEVAIAIVQRWVIVEGSL